ncbi:MAG: hypothetical protein U9Q27_00435, partial [Patescibacteria group bacterium]|nr:hypothetical protein [Patescibacteria group bacterium]
TCSSDNLTLKNCELNTDTGKMTCPTFINGKCYMYGLNGLGKLCNTYNLDGEGATLYFPKNKYPE